MVKKIKYIDNVTRFHLTNGKIYEGVEDVEDGNVYGVVDDRGEYCLFYKHRFESVEESSNELFPIY